MKVVKGFWNKHMSLFINSFINKYIVREINDEF